MAIMGAHLPYYAHILELEGVAASPFLVFGHHACEFSDLTAEQQAALPPRFLAQTFHEILRDHYGVGTVTILDWFDARADLRLDMNQPLPTNVAGRYATVFDIGSIEHVFDTRQCLANLIDLVADGGHLAIVTPVKGYFLHGLHTFHPQVLIDGLTLNGFEVRYRAYSAMTGERLADCRDGSDVLLWLVGQRVRRVSPFVVPQQTHWAEFYADTPRP